MTNKGSAKFILTKVHRSSVVISVLELERVNMYMLHNQYQSVQSASLGGHPGLTDH